MAGQNNTCIVCNIEFISARKCKCCSQRCRDRARVLKRNPNANTRAAQRLKKEACKCKGCGITYMPKQANRNSYCSRACAYRHRDQWTAVGKSNPNKPGPKTRVYFKVCAHCRGAFVTKWKLAPVCSSECRKKIACAKSLARNIETTKRARSIRKCKCCNLAFSPEYGDKRAVYCSMACRNKHAGRISKAVRRARKKGVNAETVNPFKVFNRDGWKCQLCGASTPRKQRGKNEHNSPELDHIIPLSKGGEHSYRNTQCLCRRCNISKSDRALGQLLLVG